MFFNDGLPDLNIISIAAPSGYYGGNIIYCCTESGVYTCNDYSVGIDNNAIKNNVFNLSQSRLLPGNHQRLNFQKYQMKNYQFPF